MKQVVGDYNKEEELWDLVDRKVQDKGGDIEEDMDGYMEEDIMDYKLDCKEVGKDTVAEEVGYKDCNTEEGVASLH